MTDEIGFEVKLESPYEEAMEKVVAALKEEGFGVLTQIDVRETLKKKLDQDFRPYSILGACNPPLAHRALETNAKVGMLLPCNVTVEAGPDGGSVVRILNPDIMAMVGELGQSPAMREVASQARAKLERVAKSLERQGS